MCVLEENVTALLVPSTRLIAPSCSVLEIACCMVSVGKASVSVRVGGWVQIAQRKSVLTCALGRDSVSAASATAR